MRAAITIILLFANILVVLAQQNQVDEDMKAYYNKGIHKYKGVRNIGLGLAAGGACLTAIGIRSMIEGNRIEEQEYQQYGHYLMDSGSDKYIAIGVFGIFFGINALTAGTIVSIIGQSKLTKTRSKLKKISWSPYYTPYVKGLIVSYRF